MVALDLTSAHCSSMRKHIIDDRESDNQKSKGAGSKRPKTRDITPSHVPVQDRTLRWACPFYLASPDHFKSAKACAGPGFPEISRLKEHIYRCHSRKTCPRCHASFDDDARLNLHLTQIEACSLTYEAAPDPMTEGIDRAAIRLLRSRKRVPQDERGKWYEIWKIIFPNRMPPDSPYMKLCDPSQPSHAEVLAGFSQYAEKELTRMLVDALGKECTRATCELRDLVEKMLKKVMQQYSQRFQPERNALVDQDNLFTNADQFLLPTPTSSMSTSDSASPATTVGCCSPETKFCPSLENSPHHLEYMFSSSRPVCWSPQRFGDDDYLGGQVELYPSNCDFDRLQSSDSVMSDSVDLKSFQVIPGVGGSPEGVLQESTPPTNLFSRHDSMDGFNERGVPVEVPFVHDYTPVLTYPFTMRNKCIGGYPFPFENY